MFTTQHLKFTVEVESEMALNRFKGSALRGAWRSHLRTLYCAQAAPADPLHQAMCPVCYLLSRDTGSGGDRRPYAFLPPLTDQTQFSPGQRFQFGLSVFGQAQQFMPYLLLSVGQMGQQQGLGKRINAGSNGRRERGRFRLVKIEALNRLTGQARLLLAEGDTMIQQPDLAISQADVEAASQKLAAQLKERGGRLRIEFQTPTRIIAAKKLVHRPEFEPFFARLAGRVSALQQQYAETPRRPQAEWQALMTAAQQVELIEDCTAWWDLEGHSTRLKQRQKLGGYVGHALYRAEPDAWAALLPWLLWGTLTQVGKHTVKGCGWFEVRAS